MAKSSIPVEAKWTRLADEVDWKVMFARWDDRNQRIVLSDKDDANPGFDYAKAKGRHPRG